MATPVRFTVDAPDRVARGRKVHFVHFDSPRDMADFAQAKCGATKHATATGESGWYGHDSFAASLDFARNGDMARVEASDALLAQFETLAFETVATTWRNDVCGARPDVQAFIAGQPLSMKRRVKTPAENAPLAVIVDLTMSRSIGAETIARRGAAILALVRVLSAHRPVELWAGVITGADSDHNAASIFTRIETAPLDLSVAAYVMTSASFPRRLGYSIARLLGFAGHWAFQNGSTSRNHLAALVAPAFNHATETLCIPAIHSSDDIASNPEQWIRDKVASLAPVAL